MDNKGIGWIFQLKHARETKVPAERREKGTKRDTPNGTVMKIELARHEI